MNTVHPTRMPALFVGHGRPTNMLAANRYTAAWREMGATLPKPRALLVVSAHWYIGATAVTAMPNPRTIHDSYDVPLGFFDVRYPAAGAPDVAQELAEAVQPERIDLDQDQWGLDHGTWGVLAHMYPDADVPVLQLSINGLKPLHYHLELAARLAPLRDRGIAILASGNVVHNVHRIDRSLQDTGHPWAQRFDDAVHEVLSDRPDDILRVTGHPDFAKAVPTPDHFVPLLYLAGVVGKEEKVETVLRGYSLGSVSMTAYAVGL